MARNFINYEEVERIGVYNKSLPMANRVIKLSEETGELSQACLRFINSKNVSKSAGMNAREEMLEEACDVVNVAIDIINNLGFTDKEVADMFTKKMKKWEDKFNVS